jgi:mono/diheme cytochrome c family protein
MKSREFIKRISLGLFGSLVCFSLVTAAETEQKPAKVIQAKASIGKKLFEGSVSFKNGGPACISCHNVNHKGMVNGGLFAKDLTDVYDRMGEGLSAWLSAPPFPAMATSYQNHPLTEEERTHLAGFFKVTNENKTEQVADTGYSFFATSGAIGLIIILILISIIWGKRKKNMVKKDIFDRQAKAWDAKF